MRGVDFFDLFIFKIKILTKYRKVLNGILNPITKSPLKKEIPGNTKTDLKSEDQVLLDKKGIFVNNSLIFIFFIKYLLP